MPEGRRQETHGVAIAPLVRGDGSSPGRGAGKLRFALGMFDDAKRAARAIVELANSGVARGDIDLVARQQALSEVKAALGTIETRSLDGPARLVRCRPVSGSFPWAFDVVSGGGASEQSPATEIRHLALNRLADQVLELLRSNGGVVIVRLLDDQQQHSVCSMLLRHAAAGVQTHEVRRAAASGTPA